MAIKTFAPFGYEGNICSVEADLRQGIPATDIVGLSDSTVKEVRERVRAAITNSGLDYPQKRVLISLSPADVKKEGSAYDLPIALAILKAVREEYTTLKFDNVFVMGELELSGNVRATGKMFAALQTAISNGIKYAIIPKGCEKIPDGIEAIPVSTLSEAFAVLISDNRFDAEQDKGLFYSEKGNNHYTTVNDYEITFPPVNQSTSFDNKNLDPGLVNALAVAMAGRHNMLAYGPPGCGKSIAMNVSGQLAPNLSIEEQQSVNRIWSLAGLMKPDKKIFERPFRMPHQTASIEGICGGGPSCRPGEISLAHNGILFLDEAAEFRTSVLQMLRVPLETGSITLSRAGRATTYPANFQLLMATNPCPCGNYGSHDKICLCSAKSIEQYWAKFSAPLLDRIGIRYDCNEPLAANKKTVDELRAMIKCAVHKQFCRQGKYNQDLSADEVDKHICLSADSREALENAKLQYGFSPRETTNIMKIAQTLCDMEERSYANLTANKINEAVRLHGKKSPKFPWN